MVVDALCTACIVCYIIALHKWKWSHCFYFGFGNQECITEYAQFFFISPLFTLLSFFSISNSSKSTVMVEMYLLTSPLCCDSSAAGCQDAVPVQTDAQSTFHQCLLRGSNLSTIIQQLSTTLSQHSHKFHSQIILDLVKDCGSFVTEVMSVSVVLLLLWLCRWVGEEYWVQTHRATATEHSLCFRQVVWQHIRCRRFDCSQILLMACPRLKASLLHVCLPLAAGFHGETSYWRLQACLTGRATPFHACAELVRVHRVCVFIQKPKS